MAAVALVAAAPAAREVLVMRTCTCGHPQAQHMLAPMYPQDLEVLTPEEVEAGALAFDVGDTVLVYDNHEEAATAAPGLLTKVRDGQVPFAVDVVALEGATGFERCARITNG